MSLLTAAEFQNAAPAPDKPPSDKITAAQIRSKWETGSKALARERRAAWINRAFIAGEQWITWSEARSRLEALPEPGAERVRLVVNRLRSASRIVISKLLRRHLIFEVSPTGADDASVMGARTGKAILTDLHREQNWEAMREDLAWHAWTGGTGLIAVDWDTGAGKELGTNEKGRKYGTGDIRLHTLGITDVATEPGIKDIETARWWIRSAALPPEDVRLAYNLDKRPAADASAAMTPLQHKLLNPHGDPAKDLTLVLTYYERPTSESEGQVAVVVGNQIVDGGPHPWPFPFKYRLNVVSVIETKETDSWTGATVVSDAISPQTALNQAWSSLVEHMKKAGNARLLVPEGTLRDDSVLDDDPGSIVHYTAIGGAEPKYMAPANLATWQREQPDRLKREIDDILGIHDVSRGTAPTGVESGVALRLLSEQDDTPLGHLANEMAHAWGRLGTLVLKLLEDKVTETREARVRMPGNNVEAVPWNGKALHGQTAASVPYDAVAPRSSGASYEMATQLWDRGIIKDPKQFLAMAHLPGQDDVAEGMDPDVARARRENNYMALGHTAIPESFDNHVVHIEEHNRFRKSQRYERMDDDLRELFDLHTQAHETLAAQEAGKQAAKAQVSPALAGAAQADEPAGAGDPGALAAAMTGVLPEGPMPMDAPPPGPPPEPMVMPDA